MHVLFMSVQCIHSYGTHLANKLFLGQIEGCNSESVLISQAEELVWMTGRDQPARLRQPVQIQIDHSYYSYIHKCVEGCDRWGQAGYHIKATGHALGQKYY